LYHGGGLIKRDDLPTAIIPYALTPYIENRNTHRWSYHTSVLEKGVPSHSGQAIVIPGNT